MKAITIMAIVAVLAVVPAFSQEEVRLRLTEITGTVQYFMPGEDDAYDSGFGAEGQIRFWQDAHVGFALAAGVASWDVNDQEYIESDGFTAVGASIKGSVLLVPIGGSILFRPTISDNFTLTFEGGLRYVIVESDAEAAFAVVDARGAAVGGSGDIDIDNGIIGLVAVNLEAAVSPGVSLLGGLGYQFDVAKGDAEWLGEDLGENELKAFFLRAGLVIEF